MPDADLDLHEVANMPKEYRKDLHRRLNFVYEALSKTGYLSGIFDKEWYQKISKEIDRADLSRPFQSDSALMFFELDHPLREVPWFQEVQDLVRQGRDQELDEEQKFALGLVGLDPLQTFLPVLDERLAEFAKLSYKKDVVARKLKELYSYRFKPDFRNHIFELSVLGFFAKERVLSDIEIPVGSGESTIDGEIIIDGRPILVEVTFTSQEILSPAPGVRGVGVERLVRQVIYKIRKKVADGRQLALSRGNPSILFLGRNRLGADKITSRWGTKECFDDPNFAKLSAVIVSDTWKLIGTEFYSGPQPEVPLSEGEVNALTRWFAS